VTSQCPSRAPSRKGTSVGGVSERAGAKAGGSNPFGMKNPSRGVAVKGILVFRKAAPFAGCRQNAGLGRSVASCGYPPVGAGAPMTADVRRTPRRGTPSACATYAHAPDAGTRDRRMRLGTRPSLGPLTRARRSSLCSAGASLRGWGGGRGITVGKTRASERNLHWGLGHRTLRGSPRVTAFARKPRGMSRKGRRSRSPSLRGS
jgi:hypothetical protein